MGDDQNQVEFFLYGIDGFHQFIATIFVLCAEAFVDKQRS